MRGRKTECNEKNGINLPYGKHTHNKSSRKNGKKIWKSIFRPTSILAAVLQASFSFPEIENYTEYRNDVVVNEKNEYLWLRDFRREHSVVFHGNSAAVATSEILSRSHNSPNHPFHHPAIIFTHSFLRKHSKHNVEHHGIGNYYNRNE